jgi:hypothetical protein
MLCSKVFIRILILLIGSFFTTGLISQAEIIELDSVSKQFNKVVPIDKPFTVKYKIEKGNVFTILKIKKEKGSFIGSSIKSGRVPDIDKKYWSVRKEGTISYLYINFAHFTAPTTCQAALRP